MKTLQKQGQTGEKRNETDGRFRDIDSLCVAMGTPHRQFMRKRLRGISTIYALDRSLRRGVLRQAGYTGGAWK